MPPRTQKIPQQLPAVRTVRRSASDSVLRRARRLQGLPLARRVLGVDPGLHRTGYGVIEIVSGDPHPHIVDGGVLRARADDEFPQRLQTLFDGLTEVLDEHSPEVMVIEDLFSTYAHPRSALLMAHARGVLMLAAQRSIVPVHSFTPNEVKQVVAGNGHATKSAVQQAVKSRLRLSAPPNPPDVADALAIAICFVLRQDAASKLK